MFVSGLTRPSLFLSSRSGEEDEEGVEEPKKGFWKIQKRILAFGREREDGLWRRCS
jgi:hypothetical protein